MNRNQAHIPRPPSRLREALDMVLFLIVAAGIIIALTAVAPEAMR
jgi:hypothetical protein